MDTKEILLELRTKHGLSQEQLGEQVHVTRQAVSRWETGETVPNTETLQLLSSLFDVSINTLLGSPRQLICQCCGMPLEDDNISREPDGTFNEEYCKWCYADGKFITGSRYKQGSHPRNFRRWEPCLYAAQISHRSGMESRVGLQYNDPVILLFTILEEIQYDLS